MLTALDSGSRASAPDIKQTLRPVAKRVHEDLVAIGCALQLSQALELVAAGFGFHTYKHLVSSEPRFVTSTFTAVSPEFSQYRRSSIEARASQLLGVDQWVALRIAGLVAGHLTEAGIEINALHAYLRQGPGGATILAALSAGHEEYAPVNATVAIRAGLLPLPKLPKALIVPDQDARGRLGQWSDIVDALGRPEEVRMWCWPDPDLKANVEAGTRDIYRPTPLSSPKDRRFGPSAELGLGFTFLSRSQYALPRNRPGVSISTWTPWLSGRVDSGWKTEWFSSGLISDPASPELYRSRDLPVDFSSLPQVHLCPRCRQIYVDGELGFLAHSCTED